MKPYQKQFIDFACQQQALRFGDYQLKSGRTSPYFFNIGDFKSGYALSQLGRYYAQAIIDSGIEFDMIFGPAYKGIPLAVAVAIALSEEHGRDIPYCFNRKVVKDHGEGGVFVGAPLLGRVLLVDDVISAGTTLREMVALFETQDAELVGVMTALNRAERGQSSLCATDELAIEFGLRFSSIIHLDDIVEYLQAQPGLSAELDRLQDYRAEYGAA